jgi:hypothetical protein
MLSSTIKNFRIIYYLKQLCPNIFIECIEKDLDKAKNDELERSGHSEHGSNADQDRSSSEISVDHSVKTWGNL